MDAVTLSRLIELLTLRDALDILAVTVVVYNLLILLRGTRGMQMLVGLGVVGILYAGAQWAQLVTLQALLEKLLIALPFAIIVLFQQEIRRALTHFVRNPLWGFAKQQKAVATFNDIVLAVTALSSRQIGALIVLERLQGLRNYIENGIAIDSIVSYDLLINLFSPETPLHDGAVIVQRDRIAAAACFLPLTPNPELSKEFGTRHRAALGVSEETDAVAIVVSEETGIVSVAFDGQLVRGLDGKALRNTLYELLITDLDRQPSHAAGGDR
jgi:diadenylate cyclase